MQIQAIPAQLSEHNNALPLLNYGWTWHHKLQVLAYIQTNVEWRKITTKKTKIMF